MNTFDLSKLAHRPISLAIFILIVYASACTRTDTGTTPTATTAASSGCCPALMQTTSTDTNFIDGLLTFVYDNDNCRTTFTTTCTSTQNPALNTAIIVNGNNFVAIGVGSVSFPGTCVNGLWQVANPPLTVSTIQCQLTQ